MVGNGGFDLALAAAKNGGAPVDDRLWCLDIATAAGVGIIPFPRGEGGLGKAVLPAELEPDDRKVEGEYVGAVGTSAMPSEYQGMTN